MINKLVKEIHQNAVDKGFYEGEEGELSSAEICKRLMLIVSELSEAMEADRKGDYSGGNVKNYLSIVHDGRFSEVFKSYEKDNFEDELADATIRIFDLAGKMNIDLESHILAKMRYNSTRPYKHNKQY